MDGRSRSVVVACVAPDPPPAKWSTLSMVEPRRTVMPRKSYKPEEIVAKLRQVDVLTSQGQGVAEAIRSIGVSEVTYYRWRQEFGGLKSDQVKRLKDLETENTRLRRAVSDLTLDKLILQEAARGNY
jgi:putative transposase